MAVDYDDLYLSTGYSIETHRLYGLVETLTASLLQLTTLLTTEYLDQRTATEYLSVT